MAKQKKYELLKDDFIDWPPSRLYRIRALRNFRDGAVKAGDLGGYIQSEKNLSHEGDAWVRDDAIARDEARVSEGALLFGSAHLCDRAQLAGNAIVGGHVLVSGEARTTGNGRVYAERPDAGPAP